MKDFFSISRENLQLASLKKTSGIPYKFLISTATGLGDDEGVDHYLKKGLQADSGSFGVRWEYLYSLTPWWSGQSQQESLEVVDYFLQEKVIPYVKRYPALKPLLGFPDYVRAEMLDRNDDEESAIPYYKATLKHGRYFFYSYSHGQALFYLDRDKEALNILTEALQDRPQVADIHDYRARTLEALKRPEQALTEPAKAIALDELDPSNLHRYAWRLKRHHNLEAAKTALTQALKYGSYDHRILRNLGRLYLEDFNDPNQALPYLKKAAFLRPNKSRYWLNYGWALSRLNNCKAVGILEEYKFRCIASGNCSSSNLEWANRTSQRMIWKEGCWG